MAPPRTIRQWTETAWGCWALGLAGVTAYVVLGKCVPGAVVGGFLAGDALTSAGRDPLGDVLRRLERLAPELLVLSAVLAVALVGVLRALRLLAPNPAPASRRDGWLLWTPVCAAACIAAQIAIAAIAPHGGLQPAEHAAVVQAVKTGDHLMVVLGFVVAAAVGEELVFRRFLFTNFARGNGRAVAYVVTVLLFATIQMDPSVVVLSICLGLCSTVAYERTGSVWAAIAVHMGNSAFAFLPALA